MRSQAPWRAVAANPWRRPNAQGKRAISTPAVHISRDRALLPRRFVGSRRDSFPPRQPLVRGALRVSGNTGQERERPENLNESDYRNATIYFTEMTNELIDLEAKFADFLDAEGAAIDAKEVRQRCVPRAHDHWMRELDRLNRELDDELGDGLDIITRSVALFPRA